MSIREEVINHFGKDVLSQPDGSALHDVGSGEEIFQYIMEEAFEPGIMKHGVEIGTCCGISTVMLAGFCNHITTFDIRDTPVRFSIWEHFQVKDRITSVIVKNSQEVRAAVSALSFDFAYIDAAHLYENVVFDIETVKRCGRIVFHDYDLYSVNHVMKAVHELLCNSRGRFLAIPPFAYWEAIL